MGSKQDKKHTDEKKQQKKTEGGHKREIETAVVVSILVIILGLGVGWWLNSRSDDAGDGVATVQMTEQAGQLIAADETDETLVELKAEIEALDPENEVFSQSLQDTLMRVASRFNVLGRFEEAIATYSFLIDNYPDEANYYQRRADNYVYTGEIQKAIDDNNRAIELYRTAENQEMVGSLEFRNTNVLAPLLEPADPTPENPDADYGNEGIEADYGAEQLENL